MSAPTKFPRPGSTHQFTQPPLKLKAGELLFSEGETSRAMYLLKSGALRLFKKKGESFIELDTVRSGQILGELAFLDGNARSASAEALMDCELIEVSGPLFQQALDKSPEWLKILLKTIVARLRAASNRIRQLETASTSYSYSERDGKRLAKYAFLSPPDVLKLSSALLLVCSRTAALSPSEPHTREIRLGLLQRYGHQIMGLPVAKITAFLDLLENCKLVEIAGEPGQTKYWFKDTQLLEDFITYFNEENLIEPEKRHDLTPRGFAMMTLIKKHLDRFPKDEATGTVTVNFSEIRKIELEAQGGLENGAREPFRKEDPVELIRLGYLSGFQVKSANEILTTLDLATFLRHCEFQKIVQAVEEMNEKKSGAKKAA